MPDDDQQCRPAETPEDPQYLRAVQIVNQFSTAEARKDPRYLRAVQIVSQHLSDDTRFGERGPLTALQTEALAITYVLKSAEGRLLELITDSADAQRLHRALLTIAFTTGFQTGVKWAEYEPAQRCASA